MDYRYGSHTVYNIAYHFVWVTKYRYKVLTGDVALRVRELVRQTCEIFEIKILRCCPSIACMKGLRSDVGRLLLKLVTKVRRHTIAQQLLHSPYVVRYTRCHGRCDRLPLLG